jgi:hypothetical protein
MKKFIVAFAIVATLVVALLSTANVFAQGTPPTPPTPGTGYGRGMMGGQGAGMGTGVAAGDGILHDKMISVYAQKLGISVDDLNARLAKGETMAQIASTKGLTAEQFTSLMTNARTQAIDQAVKDGTLSQAQSDWMKQRGNGGGMMGGNAGRGAGRGMRGNPTDCPYYPQSNP